MYNAHIPFKNVDKINLKDLDMPSTLAVRAYSLMAGVNIDGDVVHVELPRIPAPPIQEDAPEEYMILAPQSAGIGWKRELSQKLADPKYLLKLMGKGKRIHKGPLTLDVLSSLKQHPYALVRGRKLPIILLLQEGEPIAGIERRNPLSPSQARDKLSQLIESGDEVTVLSLETIEV